MPVAIVHYCLSSLSLPGIIFIGKEIDDKLANEVIGVLCLEPHISSYWRCSHECVMAPQ